MVVDGQLVEQTTCYFKEAQPMDRRKDAGSANRQKSNRAQTPLADLALAANAISSVVDYTQTRCMMHIQTIMQECVEELIADPTYYA